MLGLKVKVHLDVLLNVLYHMVVVGVPVLAAQLVAVNGHLDRDVVIAAVGGAAVGAWHSTFPNGWSDVKATLKKLVSW